MNQSRKQSNVLGARQTKEQKQLQAMLYGAEQWNKTPHKHQFRERNRTKELVKNEFVPYKAPKK